ncbi:hypothetical protein AB0L59_36080 [Streptomyces sp. NPDC052109]|uniref:hypothetical protein n=1 Tax=Streptomyces sp. NPDC052109 TaxID=3155527 RepID=UPI003441AC5F
MRPRTWPDPARSSAAAIQLILPETSGTLCRDHVGDQLPLPSDGGDVFTARIGSLITVPTAPPCTGPRRQAARSLHIDVAPHQAGAKVVDGRAVRAPAGQQAAHLGTAR